MTPRSGLPGATAPAMRAPARFFRSTIGARGDSRSCRSSDETSQSISASQIVRTIRAKGLFIPVLAAPQLGDCRFVGCVTDQMVSAQAFHGSDSARSNVFGEQRQRFRSRDQRGISIQEPQCRSTRLAAGRLCMEPPIGRIFIFLPACGTERKSLHRGSSPIVRTAGDNRQSRPAMRAVQKRVAISPVGRIEQFVQAIATSGHVRGNQHSTFRIEFAGFDPKLPVAEGHDLGPENVVDASQWRRVTALARRGSIPATLVHLQLQC